MPALTLDRLQAAVCFLKMSLDDHGVRFAPPLSAQALEKFECEHTVRLPEDYRFFLTLIGNGGQSGPCFEGVLPLGVFPFTSNPESLLNNLPDLFPFTEPSILIGGGGGQQQDSDDDDTDLCDTTSDDNGASTDDSLDGILGNTYSSSDNDDREDDYDDYDDDDDDDDKYMTSYSLDEELYPNLQVVEQQQQQQRDGSIKHNDTMTVGGYLILGTLAQDRQYFWILICGGACRGEVWIMNKHGFYFPTSRRLKFYEWVEDWLLGGDKINASLWACGLYDPQFSRCFQSGIDNATSDSGSDQEEDYGNSSDNDSNSGYSYDDEL
ncbi:hypothetical protein [Absidia glauca]|uniref:Knr4/Smi1-like domain-containing protein n=1 Tax=Absidia glauca TaxID=4829 RepID=A0A163JXS7_ABSGL|nr:hypothetical protein [Absidia glauca]